MNFASFMNSASFPSIIREYFQNTPEMHDDNILPLFFAENAEVKIHFANWVQDHQFVVANTPRLFKAMNLAIDPSSYQEEQARHVNNLYLLAANNETLMEVENNSDFKSYVWGVIQEVLTNSSFTIDEFPVNYALMALDLHQAGIITEPQLISLLSKCDRNGLLPLENIGTLNDVLFSLNAEGNTFFAILSIKNNADQTVLHSPEFFEIIEPLFIYHSNPEFILPLLSCRANAGLMQDDGGQTPLHNPLIFKKAISFLRRLDSTNLSKLLSIQDNSGRTVLHHPLTFRNAVKLLEDLSPKDLNVLLSIEDAWGNISGSNLKSIDLLGIKDNQGNTPLHCFESFKSSLEDLGALPPDDLFRILLKDDSKGNTPLHYIDIFELALPLLEKMPGELLCKLFSITDGECNTPLCYLDSFKAAMPLFAKLPSKDLVKILGAVLKEKLVNKYTTLLHDEETFQMAIPLLEKLQPDDLIDLLSSKELLQESRNWNSYEKPLLYHINIVQLAMPLLEKLQEEDLVKLLRFPNERETPLSHKNILEQFIPLLQKLTPIDHIHILFPSRGKAPVRNAKTLAIAMPIIEELDPSFLIEAFSINNLMHENGVEVFELLIPFLEKFNHDALNKYFSIKDRFIDGDLGGRTLLFDHEIFKSALPFLEKLEPHILFGLLSIQSYTGQIVLHDLKILELAIPLLKKLEHKHLVHLFSIKGYEHALEEDDSSVQEDSTNSTREEEDDSPVEVNVLQLHKNDSQLQQIVSQLQHLPQVQMEDQSESEESEEVIPENHYKLPLHSMEALKIVMPFLETQDSVFLDELFSIRNEQNLTLMEYDKDFILTPLMHKLDLSLAVVIEYFSMVNLEGQTRLQNPKIFESFLLYFSTRAPKDVVQILSIKNRAGQIPLHSPQVFKIALQLFKHFFDDEINFLFSVQDKEGRTVLHNPEIYEMCNESISLYGKLKPEVFQIRNSLGFIPMEWEKISPSQQWLVKPKPAMDLKVLTEDEYREKSQCLKKDLDAIWESFVFGNQECDVPEIFLEINIHGQRKTFSPENIKQCLDEIIDTILTKKVWLGTPKADEIEALHLFYSQMLINFEQLLAGLSLSEAREKAGYLINIAKVRLEGRCAGGYQSEIEQARMLADSNLNGEDAKLEILFNRLASSALIQFIENIIREKASGDSHIYNRMLFLVGLAPADDPLPPLNATVGNCLNIIKHYWTKGRIVIGLAENFGRLGVDQLQFWFEQLAPADYGQAFLTKQEKLQQEEQNIVKDLKARLLQKGLGELLINSCVEIFQSTQGAGLRIGSPARKFISEAVFNKLAQASSIKQVEEAQDLLNLDKEQDRSKLLELLDKEDELKNKLKNLEKTKDKASADWVNIELVKINDERKSLQQKSMGLTSEFYSLKLIAERKVMLADLFKKTHPNLSNEELDVIFSAKQQFDMQISDLAESEGVDFVPCASGLPSAAVEKSRRVDYASQFFTADQNEILQLNKKGVVEILLRIGVLQSA